MAKLNDLIVTGDTKMLGKLHANADTATTASSIFDSGNKSLITLNYSAEGISNPTWLAAWNGYELRGVARASLSVGTADKASYLTSQGAIVANTRTQSASQAVLAGGWSTNEAGFGSQYGTTLDISGFATWYHRLAFHTGGEIDYWIGINTNTLTKKGRLLTSANYTSYALPRDGSVAMTGVLHLKAEQYTDSITAGALNANNSNIYGVNSIYTADLADSASEGIHFYRTSTTVDSLWGKNGVLYFSPNRTVGSGSSTDYTILHTGNYKTYALARDGSNTMTGALQFASSTGTWASTANYANSLILFGGRNHDAVTSRHYFPWMGGYEGVNSQGYLGTITMGLFHGAPSDAGLFIGASWDQANADTFFYFTRSGTFETPRAAVGGYNNTSYALSTSSFICNSWVRTKGSSGWYNEDYAGGWYMSDGTYVRSYSSKPVMVGNTIYVGTDSGAGTGLSLYSTSAATTYGIHMSTTNNYGKHGDVQSDWATYFNMNAVGQRGWIFRAGNTNVASVSANGVASFSAVGDGTAYMAFPKGGTLTIEAPNQKGYLTIVMPAGFSSTMVKFKVSVYNYVTGTSVDYIISGYCYGSDNKWYNPTAYCIGPRGSGLANLTVKYGMSGSNPAIQIGAADTPWEYPNIAISDVYLGHSRNYGNWAKSWTVSITTTAITSITQTISNTYMGNFAGTDNKIAKFANGGKTITNSTITDNGSTVTIGVSTSISGTLSMNNNGISGVGDLAFADPGVSEGITWTGGNGWYIYESPDNLTNAAGNLQFVHGSTRRLTINKDGYVDINARLVVRGNGSSYNEGIRILPASNGWSNIFFSADSTLSGTHNGGWLIGRRGAAGSIAGGIGDFTIEEEDSTGANLTIYKNSGGAHLRGGFSLTGLITATSGSNHAGVKVGGVYINAIGQSLILQNLDALRFGGDSWDWNVWAGLKYNPSNKYIYLGLADGSVFTANTAQSGGRILTPGISYFHVGNQTSYYFASDGNIYGHEIYSDSWFRTYNACGWYNESYGCHVRPNTISSYGGVRIHGNARNGYEGLHFGSSNNGITIMSIDGSHQGLYNEAAGRWIIYYPGSGGCVGIGTSGLNASYNVTMGSTYIGGALYTTGLIQSASSGKTLTIGSQNTSYCHYTTDASVGHWFNKNTYVQGDIYAGASYDQKVLHAGNYSSYALPLSGGTMTGNITLGTYGMLGFGNTIPATHKEVTSFTPEANAVWLATTGGGGESAGICLDGATIRFWTPNDSVIEFIDSDVTAGTNYASVKFGTVTGGTWNGSTIAVAYGGTGITSNPSMLVNLGSTSAASVFAASPRPGVTGTLGVANGGTGKTSWTANQLVYSSGTTTLANANIYYDSDELRPTSNNTIYLGGSSYVWKGVYATTFYASSDIRKKKEITNLIINGDILSLPLYQFKYIDNDEDTHIGCMAQDLQQICPELVSLGDDGFLSIKENRLVYILLDRMKKMQKEIDELKEERQNG